jgi:hypothetical protein
MADGALTREDLMALGGRPLIEGIRRYIHEFWERQGIVEAATYYVRRSQEEINRRMRAAVYNELRIAELCAAWVRDVPDTNLRMSLAKQSWQEFRHYKLVCDRLRRLGMDPAACEPTAAQRELFSIADEFHDWLQRLAYTQYAAEGCTTYDQNEETIRVAEELGDHETASLYRDHIQPDERFHGQIGAVAIRDHATTPERKAAVIAAVDRFLTVRQRMFSTHHRQAARA